MDNPYESPTTGAHSSAMGNWRPYWTTSAVVVVAWTALLVVSLFFLPIKIIGGKVEATWETTADVALGDAMLHQHYIYTSLPQALFLLGSTIVLTLVAANVAVYALRRKLRRGRS